MSKNCIYYVEGKCEEQLINALKLEPAKLIPGKVKVFNPIQQRIPQSQLLAIKRGTIVALVFDTDIPLTQNLKDNIELIKKYCKDPTIVFMPQVLDFEDELVRCSDINSVLDLTRSLGASNFKTDFCRMKPVDCRNSLDRHHLDVDKLWTKEVPEAFSFITNSSNKVKSKRQ